MERSAVALGRMLVEQDPNVDVEFLIIRGPAGWDESSVTTHTGYQAVRRLRAILEGDARSTVVVVGLWAATILGAARLRPGRGVKLVMWEHSLLDGRLKADPKLRRMLLIARSVYRQADEVVSVSRSVHRTVKTLLDVDSRVIPNIVDINCGYDSECLKLPRPSRTILAVGALAAVKNHILLVRALAFLPGWRLRIAGEGPERSRLVNEIRDRALADRVELLGEIHDTSVLYRDASVLACPSLNETFGLALFEAASWRVPVAALDVAAVNEAVPELIVGRVLNEPFDPSRFAELIFEVSLLDACSHSELYTEAEARRSAYLSREGILAAWREVAL